MSLFLIPIMALLNRLSGMDRWAPGRNIYYTAPVAGIIAGLLVDPMFGLLTTLGFLAYRLPGWFNLIDVGSDAGQRGEEFLLLALRSAFFGIPFILLAVSAEQRLVWIARDLLAGVGCAAAYALAWGSPLRKTKEPATWAELIAGACLGAFLWSVAP